MGEFATVVLAVSRGHVDEHLVMAIRRWTERGGEGRRKREKKQTARKAKGGQTQKDSGHDTMKTPDIRD
jgi:hypothetical protein